ncbi:MAG: hypothetical protein ACRCY3_08900 [Sphingorhabdus sp.]
MRKIKLVMALLAASLVMPLSAKAPKVETYRTHSKHPDRLAIGKLLGEGKLDVIDPFHISHIRILRGKKLDIARAEGRTTSRFDRNRWVFDSILIRKAGGTWQEIWAESTNGAFSCEGGLVYAHKLNSYVINQGFELKKLWPEIVKKMQMKDKDCDFGDLSLNEEILGKLPPID